MKTAKSVWLKHKLSPKYSIIVHLNGRKTLPFCLGSLLKQTISKDLYEILFADGASEEYIFSGELKKIFSLDGVKYLFKKGANFAELCNLGLKEARGEIIFFTESNCAAPENWLEEFIKYYELYSDILGAGGWIKAVGGHRRYAQKYLDILRQKHGAIALREEKKTNFLDSLLGRVFNMSYKKAALLEIGGFDANFLTPEMAGIDAEKRIMESGGFLIYLPFMVEDHGNKNFSGLIKDYFARGRDFYYWGSKHPKNKFFYFQNLSNFIIYSGVRLIEAKTLFFAELAASTATFFGKTFAKFFKKPVPIMLFESKKEPPETFEIIKKNQNGQVITRFTRFDKIFDKTNDFLIGKNKFYSIVIPTYNRSRGLINALNHLIAQTIPKDNYEIIVVDDGSTDDTEVQIAKYKIQNTKYKIRYFKTENGGPAKARNFGIERARGEFVFFTDDDCTVPKDWMETILAGFKKYPDAVGVGGWIWPPEGELEKSAVSRFLHFESFSGHPIVGSYIKSHEILSNDPLMCFGVFAYNTANVCYRKETLKATGGFREDFYWPGAEDNELAFRIANMGHLLLYLPFHVTHPKAMSLSEFIKLHFRRGANGYLLRTMHWELLEKLKPDFVNNYGSMASFISRFNGPEKFLALLEWLSISTGIRYMERALKRRIVA